MKIRKENTYYTSDNTPFTGKNALEKAKQHQREFDFGKNAKKLIPEARKIMDLPEINEINGYGSEIKTVEEVDLTERISYWVDDEIETFEDILDHFVELYIDVPEIVKLLNFIDKKFKSK